MLFSPFYIFITLGIAVITPASSIDIADSFNTLSEKDVKVLPDLDKNPNPII